MFPRDVIKDAAILTTAERAKQYMSVQTFLAKYAKAEWEEEYFKEVLSDYYLTYYTYSKDHWDLEGKYLLVWSEDSDA